MDSQLGGAVKCPEVASSGSGGWSEEWRVVRLGWLSSQIAWVRSGFS